MPRVCSTALEREKSATASRGMANAAFSRMKPILLLSFLALGPALAEQFPVLPRIAASATDAVAQPSGTAPPAAQREAQRIWLCGR
jgi:hypothetical protein